MNLERKVDFAIKLLRSISANTGFGYPEDYFGIEL